MNRLKLPIAVLSTLLISTLPVRAQNSKVGVVDYERAVEESAEGKKSSEKLRADLQANAHYIEKSKIELYDQQKKLQTGARTLSDPAKADIQRDIDRRT